MQTNQAMVTSGAQGHQSNPFPSNKTRSSPAESVIAKVVFVIPYVKMSV